MSPTSQKTASQLMALAKKAVKKKDYTNAFELYSTVLKRHPNHQAAKKSLRKLQKKKQSQTLQPSGKNINPDQDQMDALVHLYQTNRFQEAEIQIRPLLQTFPHSFILINIFGAILQGLGQHETAVAAFEKAIVLNPGYADAYNNMGIALRDMGRFRDAVKSYDKAIEIMPGYAQAYNNRGVALRDLREFEAATHNYEKAISINPDYAQAYNNLGVALFDMDAPEKAIHNYNRAIELIPEYAEAYFNRGIAFQFLEQAEAALTNYQKAIEIQPGYAQAYANSGQLYQDQGNIDKAIEAYTKMLTISPDDANAHNSLGTIYYDLGYLEKAKTCFEKTISLKPDFGQAYHNLGNALTTLNQPEDALKYFETAIRLEPHSPHIRYAYGVALYETGQLDKAAKSYQEALSLNTDYAEAHNGLGTALGDLGRFEDSLAGFQKAIELKPDYAEAYNNHGGVLKNFGEIKKAVTNFEKAIELKPDYAEAHRNLCMVKKYNPGDEQMELMIRLITNPKITPPDRMRLNFALAKAYDDLGDVDHCFACLKTANQLRTTELNYSIKEDQDLFANLKKIFSAEFSLVDSPSDMTMRPVFILGMPRSGTSLAEQILAAHSSVHGAGELNTLTNMVSSLLPEMEVLNTSEGYLKIFQKLRNGYFESLSSLNVPEKVITDKMPLNFRWIGFILSALPEAKIIHMVRDPRAVCWSIYKLYFSSKGNGYAYDMGHLSTFYQLYQDIMTFWHNRFPNRIYNLYYETLTENQEQETRKLLAYCDLPWENRCLDFHRTRRIVKTASAGQVRKQMYQGSSNAWKKYKVHLEPLINALMQSED